MGNRHRSALAVVLTALLPVVALSMMAAVLIPADYWRRQTDAATYRGFDRNLLSVSEGGRSSAKGMVEVSQDRLTLVAVPHSNPTVHLVTSPLSFRVNMQIRVLQTDGAGSVSVGVWSPRTSTEYSIGLNPDEGGVVTADTSVRGERVRSQRLGRYSPGLLYHLETTVDRTLGTIAIGVSSVDTPPGGGGVLRLIGGPADRDYRDVTSKPIRITAGREYAFGSLVKLVEGSDSYKIVIQWLDQDNRFLSFSNNWRPVGEIDGWTWQEFRARAPDGAAHARLTLGSGNGTQLLFARPFVFDASSPGVNLLQNGNFQEGVLGWEMLGSTPRKLEILPAYVQTLKTSVTAATTPQLLNSRRLSLSVSASSQDGITRAVLQNYSLSVLNHRWQAVKVDDARARLLTMSLALIGAVLCVGQVWIQMSGVLSARWHGRPRLQSAIRALWSRRLYLPGVPFGILFVVLLYGIINALLFSTGSLPFDMEAAKVWTYTAARHGPSALYFLPNTVSPAKVWGGVPFHEAVFPYHPAMAYYFVSAGWLYERFLNGPGPLSVDVFQLEWLLKSLNVLFGALDAIMIYLILRRIAVDHPKAVGAALLFLFNPALIFSMSIWGQNHVVSLLPLLVAIWAAQSNRPTAAWIALAATALTRPQMLVPGLFVAIVLLRKYAPKTNLHAVCWAIVIGFIILSPLALSISPSLPVDISLNQLYVQEGGGNEEALTTVSLGAYSIWPLVTRLVAGESGLGRFSTPSLLPLVGGFTYQRISQILVVGALLGTAGLMMGRRSKAAADTYMPLIAVGTTAFLVLKTGLGATHFVIALPIIILTRQSLSPRVYYAIVAIWTLVTYVSMYGTVAYAIQPVPDLAPALDPGTNRLTQLHALLYGADWAITVFTLLSGLAVILLTFASFRPRV